MSQNKLEWLLDKRAEKHHALLLCKQRLDQLFDRSEPRWVNFYNLHYILHDYYYPELDYVQELLETGCSPYVHHQRYFLLQVHSRLRSQIFDAAKQKRTLKRDIYFDVDNVQCTLHDIKGNLQWLEAEIQHERQVLQKSNSPRTAEEQCPNIDKPCCSAYEYENAWEIHVVSLLNCLPHSVEYQDRLQQSSCFSEEDWEKKDVSSEMLWSLWRGSDHSIASHGNTPVITPSPPPSFPSAKESLATDSSANDEDDSKESSTLNTNEYPYTLEMLDSNATRVLSVNANIATVPPVLQLPQESMETITGWSVKFSVQVALTVTTTVPYLAHTSLLPWSHKTMMDICYGGTPQPRMTFDPGG